MVWALYPRYSVEPHPQTHHLWVASRHAFEQGRQPSHHPVTSPHPPSSIFRIRRSPNRKCYSAKACQLLVTYIIDTDAHAFPHSQLKVRTRDCANSNTRAVCLISLTTRDCSTQTYTRNTHPVTILDRGKGQLTDSIRQGN